MISDKVISDKVISGKVISGKVISGKVISGKRKLIALSLITYHFLLCSCGGPAPQIPANKLPESSISEDMMLLNKEFIALENEEINRYIDSLNLDMDQTPAGLRYKILNEGVGEHFRKGDEITFSYSIRTLDNVACESLKNVTKTIELGKGAIESGIEDAAMLLKASGKGEFIIPSYLAYGVSGYKNCVPAWTPVFCEINIIKSKLKR